MSACASALVDMLDRESSEVKKAMMYPITRVALQEVRGEGVVVVRSFVVDEAGHWVEEQ